MSDELHPGLDLALQSLTLPSASAPSASVPARPARGRHLPHERLTCAVCFGVFAVLKSGNMAQHGFELPDRNAKLCSGGRFPPVERSPLGLEHLVGRLAVLRKVAEKRVLAMAGQPEHPRKQYLEALLRADLQGLDRRMLALAQMIKSWRPREAPAAGDALGSARGPKQRALDGYQVFGGAVRDLFEAIDELEGVAS